MIKIYDEELQRIEDISYYNHNYFLIKDVDYKGCNIMYKVHSDMYGLESIQFGNIQNGSFEPEYFCYGYEDLDFTGIEGEE